MIYICASFFAVLAEDAIKAALKDYKLKKNPEAAAV